MLVILKKQKLERRAAAKNKQKHKKVQKRKIKKKVINLHHTKPLHFQVRLVAIIKAVRYLAQINHKKNHSLIFIIPIKSRSQLKLKIKFKNLLKVKILNYKNMIKIELVKSQKIKNLMHQILLGRIIRKINKIKIVMR